MSGVHLSSELGVSPTPKCPYCGGPMLARSVAITAGSQATTYQCGKCGHSIVQRRPVPPQTTR